MHIYLYIHISLSYHSAKFRGTFFSYKTGSRHFSFECVRTDTHVYIHIYIYTDTLQTHVPIQTCFMWRHWFIFQWISRDVKLFFAIIVPPFWVNQFCNSEAKKCVFDHCLHLECETSFVWSLCFGYAPTYFKQACKVL